MDELYDDDADLVKEDGEADRLEELDYRLHDIERLAEQLRCAVMAILGHVIRQQHLPPAPTSDSDLWNRLRSLAGPEACAALFDHIRKVDA